MLFKIQESPALKSNRMSLKLAALLLSSLVMVPVAGMLLQKTAAASDLESIQSAAEGDGHFVRIGLNKSIVIRLPAEAHDVIVGNPEVVDAVVRSKNTAYLFARTIGQTNIFFFDKSGQQILNLDLEVAIDVTALRNLLQRSIPGTKITVDTVNNSVVLGGTAPNAAEAKFAEDITTKFLTREVDKAAGSGFVNTIKITGEDQVMLKVRVVEVQRDVLEIQPVLDIPRLIEPEALPHGRDRVWRNRRVLRHLVEEIARRELQEQERQHRDADQERQRLQHPAEHVGSHQADLARACRRLDEDAVDVPQQTMRDDRRLQVAEPVAHRQLRDDRDRSAAGSPRRPPAWRVTSRRGSIRRASRSPSSCRRCGSTWSGTRASAAMPATPGCARP